MGGKARRICDDSRETAEHGALGLNDKPLEPDAETEITVALPEGKRRRLKVRADEVETLSEKGSDASSSWSGVRRYLSWKGFKVSFTVLALVVTRSYRR